MQKSKFDSTFYENIKKQWLKKEEDIILKDFCLFLTIFNFNILAF